ncbi:MAG TPA: hypothetical protein VN970_01155, partial [Thermoanaerobaculia bacterium]|nr:hypothetical protein [Thermoanaerobaculia bacterium]
LFGVLLFCGVLSALPIGLWLVDQPDTDSPSRLILMLCLFLVAPLSLAALWGLKEYVLRQKKPLAPWLRKANTVSFAFGPAGWLWIVLSLTGKSSPSSAPRPPV